MAIRAKSAIRPLTLIKRSTATDIVTETKGGYPAALKLIKLACYDHNINYTSRILQTVFTILYNLQELLNFPRRGRTIT